MQLRADFFNIVNHPNSANPFLPAFIADAGAGGFQVSNGREVAGASGGYPITATGDVGIGNPFIGGGGPPGNSTSSRLQF